MARADEAGKAIGKALETNSTLKELDLFNNNLGDEAGLRTSARLSRC